MIPGLRYNDKALDPGAEMPSGSEPAGEDFIASDSHRPLIFVVSDQPSSCSTQESDNTVRTLE